jgi:ribosomal L7/L12-like protein
MTDDAKTLTSSAAAALQQGNKVDAIRLLRKETGIGLKEARELVETTAQATFPNHAALSPGEVPRARSGVHWLAALALIIGLLVYFFWQRQP